MNFLWKLESFFTCVTFAVDYRRLADVSTWQTALQLGSFLVCCPGS